MRLPIPACMVATVLLAACTPAHLTPLKAPTASERAELLVYRESAFNAGGVGLIFGADGQDYTALGNSQYAQVYLTPGPYQFFARSTQGDRPYVLPLNMATSQRICLKAYANPANLAKAVLPLAYYFGHTFLLEQVACPTAEELAKYSQEPVEYQ
jgi:hypothetical protein